MSKRLNPTPSDVLWLASVKSDPGLVPMAQRKWIRAYRRTQRAYRRRKWQAKATELVGMVALSFAGVTALLLLLFGLS